MQLTEFALVSKKETHSSAGFVVGGVNNCCVGFLFKIYEIVIHFSESHRFVIYFPVSVQIIVCTSYT